MIGHAGSSPGGEISGKHKLTISLWSLRTKLPERKHSASLKGISILLSRIDIEKPTERLQNTPAQPLQVSVCFEERGL